MLVSFNNFMVKPQNNVASKQSVSFSGIKALKQDAFSFSGNKVWHELVATGAQKPFLKEVESSMYGDTIALKAYIKDEKVEASPENIKAIAVAVENLDWRDEYLLKDYRKIFDDWGINKEKLQELEIKQGIINKLGYSDAG